MKPLHLIFSLVIVLSMAACNNARVHSPADFSVGIYTPTYASGFDIRAAAKSSATLITVRNPWQGATDVEQYLLLVREGDKAPTDFPGQVVNAPVHHVVCMSSSHVAMFDAIGQIQRVSGVSGIDYISNAHVQSHRLCGEVRDVGYDTNLNFELLAAMHPDLVLLYGVSGEDGVVTGKLRELGIPYLYIGEYVEQSPLGKAEWLMVMAELCNCRDEGRAVFDGIAQRYNATKERLAAQLDTAALPTVLLNTPYRDTWFLPSSESYMVRLLSDAGGKTYTATNQGNASQAIDMEQAYLLATKADAWLNTGACNTLAELTAQNPRFAAMPVVRNRAVWNNNRRQTPAGGSDFWESGVVRPDLILQDLVRILHPERSDTESTYYYKQLE